MQRQFITLAAIAASGGFALLLYLMYQMQLSMALMVGDIGRMSGDVRHMAAQLERMTDRMDQLNGDVKGMRQSVDNMAQVIARGGQQMEQISPMGLMQGVIPGNQPSR